MKNSLLKKQAISTISISKPHTWLTTVKK